MSDAFVLAGGLGTRLRSAVPDAPKVLAPVAGRPMLAYLLDQLAEARVSRVVLGVGYLAEKVEAAFGATFRGMALVYSRESAPLGTGGALALAARHFTGDHVLVLNGDSFVAAHLPMFQAWHRARRADISVLLTEVEDAGRYGAVEVDAEGRITAFREKAAGPRGRAWINGGVYLVGRSAWEGIPTGQPVSFEREVLSGGGLALYGFPGGGAFIDIGVPESLALAEAFFRDTPRGAPARTSAAALLDLEGTVIAGGDGRRGREDLRLLPGAASGLARLRALGLKLVVVSAPRDDQIAPDTEARMRQVEARLRTSLASAGVTLDGFFFCPHAADAGCDCRAPALALVRRAAEMLGFAPSETVVIGSTPSYVHMGRILGVPSILVPPGRGSAATSRADGHPDFVVDSLEVAADVIPHIPLSLHRSRVSDAPGASRSAGRGDRMS